MTIAAAKLQDLDFTVLPPDTSLHERQTQPVEVRKNNQLIGTYRYNLHDMKDDQGAPWRIYAPLVIKWAEGYTPEAGVNHAIIDDCLTRTGEALRQLAPGLAGIFLATGNLTIERAGKPFFSARSWNIVELKRQHGCDFNFSEIPEPLSQIGRYIDKISAPFRTHPLETDALCFAWLRFSHEK